MSHRLFPIFIAIPLLLIQADRARAEEPAGVNEAAVAQAYLKLQAMHVKMPVPREGSKSLGRKVEIAGAALAPTYVITGTVLPELTGKYAAGSAVDKFLSIEAAGQTTGRGILFDLAGKSASIVGVLGVVGGDLYKNYGPNDKTEAARVIAECRRSTVVCERIASSLKQPTLPSGRAGARASLDQDAARSEERIAKQAELPATAEPVTDRQPAVVNESAEFGKP